MSNIHNITAESVQSVQPAKSRSTNLSKSRQDFATRTATSISARSPQSQTVAKSQDVITPENIRDIQKIQNILAGDIVSKALFDAGIDKNDFTMEVVNSHIKNFMPLTKENIEKVIQQSQIYKDTSFDILVMLNKAGIEVTPENIQQMEKYVMHNNQLADTLSDIMNSYIDLISSKNTNNEKAIKFAEVLIQDVIPENSQTLEKIMQQPKKNVTPENVINDADIQEFSSFADKLQSSQKYSLQALVTNLKTILNNTEDANISGQRLNRIFQNHSQIDNLHYPVNSDNISNTENTTIVTDNADIITHFNNINEGFKAKTESLIFSKLKEVIEETLNYENKNFSQEEGKIEKQALKDLLGSTFVKKLIKTEIENKWFLDLKDINPQDIKNKYNEINNDLKKVLIELNSDKFNNIDESQDSDSAKANPSESSDTDTYNTAKTTPSTMSNEEKINTQTLNIRDNLNFISQFKKDMVFIDLPLKFREQNITSEIYVLSNKNSKRKFLTGESVNVLLKLTLANLGELDIYVTLSNKSITSKFLTANDKIVNLINENIDDFRQTMNEKGYRFKHKVTKDENFFDFSKDFINKNTPKVAFRTHGLNIKV